MNGLAPNFVPAYTPDPETLERLRPPTTPVQSALGAAAARHQEWVDYHMYHDDLVAHPDEEFEPRLGGAAGDGHVSETAFTLHAAQISEIDTHYAPLLTEAFYAKHRLQPGTPLSRIVQDAIRRNPDGSFAMSREDYFSLLRDMHGIHEREATAFAERLPFYTQDYAERLEAGGLGRLVKKFNMRASVASIQYDDGFDTLARGGVGRHERHGDTFTIVVAPLPSEEHETLTHEFAHLIEGDSIALAFPDAPHVVNALREATAAHTTAYLLYGGDIQAISPGFPDRQGDYDTYRRMLDLFCNGGKQSVSMHQVIDALTAEIPENPEAGQMLRTAIAGNFPDHPTLFQDLERMLSTLHASENVPIESQEQAVVDFLDRVREQYQSAGRRVGRIGALLRKIPVLSRV